MIQASRTRRGGDLQASIRDVAWRQIALHGAAALSLRAIARELGITAPAIYNYYRRRDDLVTALIIEAFTSFGDGQVAARDAAATADDVGRLLALGLAYRQWALSNPARYQLIFGAPVPGYEPPLDQIQPSGARALGALVEVVDELRASGRLRADGLPDVMPGCGWSVELWGAAGSPVSAASVTVALVIWARVHGLVSLEIGGHLPPFGDQGDALYRWELARMAQQFLGEA
jgi:AcrR family transcriptional regulator